MYATKLLFLAVCLCACGTSKPEQSSSQQAVTGSAGSDCDMTPIDDNGTLPACAAGMSTGSGPGRPFDYSPGDSGVPALPVDLAANAAAEALATARNPPTQDPIDRGFAPPPHGNKPISDDVVEEAP